MIDLENTSCADTQAFLEAAIAVAEHYGFKPLEQAFVDVDKTKVQAEGISYVHQHERFYLPAIKEFAEHAKYLRHHHALTYQVHMKATNKRQPVALSLHIAGVRRPIAEATLIATARAILKEIGIENTMVKMTAYGNIDSSSRYNRDLTQFIKKALGPATAVSVAKEVSEHPRRVYAKFVIDGHPQAHLAPNPMDYLNDEARAHLRGVLEYLESAEIPYEFDSKLTGSEDIADHALFEIHQPLEGDKTVAVAHGARMNIASRKAFRQQVDTTSVVLTCEGKGTWVPGKLKQKKGSAKTRFYFAHISDEAKKLTLKVLRSLFDADVRVGHRATYDTLSEQMGNDESRAATHVIIIGHKEAVEHTAIIREVSTRAQKVIPLSQLSSYLKRLQG
jgi:histidyl-tRNA synthetase